MPINSKPWIFVSKYLNLQVEKWASQTDDIMWPQLDSIEVIAVAAVVQVHWSWSFLIWRGETVPFQRFKWLYVSDQPSSHRRLAIPFRDPNFGLMPKLNRKRLGFFVVNFQNWCNRFSTLKPVESSLPETRAQILDATLSGHQKSKFMNQ